MKPTPPLPQQATAQGTTGLFDPYWSGGSVWKASGTHSQPQWYALAGDSALNQLEALLPQFQAAMPGWHALRLTPLGLDLKAWSTPNQLAVLEGLLTELIPPLFPHFVFVLPNATVVVLFALRPEAAQASHMVAVVSRINALLVGEDNAPRTAVQLLNLATPQAALASWPEAVREALNFKANQLHQAQQLAQIQKLKSLLNPTSIASAYTRNSSRFNPEVLVVEDDPSTSLLLTTLLEGMVKCSTANSALNAAQAFELHLPQLVLLDLGLPDIDGLTLLKHLKAAMPKAQVVVLTANATRENLQAASRLGASGFLAKPFTRAKLQEALQKHGLIASPKV